MTPPQIAAAAAGALMLIPCAWAFIRRRTLRLRALVGMLVGGGLLYAAFRPSVIVVMGPDSDALRLRWIVGLLSLTVLTITLESIRASRMRERYALLWLAAGALLLVGALSNPPARWVERLTGMSYGAVVGVTVFAFMLLLLFHLCEALSGAQDRIARIARELARVEEIVRRSAPPGGSRPLPPPGETPPASTGPSAPT
mgnify:CR=1 FL=1